jgi:hypothetical protein
MHLKHTLCARGRASPLIRPDQKMCEHKSAFQRKTCKVFDLSAGLLIRADQRMCKAPWAGALS